MTESNAEDRAHWEDRIGQVFDERYVIEDILGMGGLGVVYRARHQRLNLPVAIKVMHPEFASHPELRRRFDREAKALSALKHPNIVAITDFGNHEGAPYLVMELVEGEPLSQRLEQHSLPSIEDALKILRQSLVGLKAAHEQGVLHRDLKPGNIMLRELSDAPIHAVIVDFGLAKIADPSTEGPPDPTLTKLGTIIGTPSYMSPEQAASEPADERADLYSLGIILYQMLVGRCPFVHENRMDVLRAHLATKVPDPASLREGLVLSPKLQAVLDKSLKKDRDHRFASAAEMLRAVDALPTPAGKAPAADWLAPAKSGEPIGSASTIAVNSSMLIVEEPLEAKAGGRARQIAALVVSLALVLAVAGGWAVLVSDGDHGGGGGSDDGAVAASGESSTPGEDAQSTPGSVHDDERAEAPRPRPAATDPLAGPVPRPLRALLRRVRRGNPLSRDQQRVLRDYQREHREDPRPSLILAHDHTNQQWYSDAIERYEIVDRIDPSARGNRWMRDDLLSMVRTPAHGDRAAELVRTIYGPEAVRVIEQRLAQGTDVADEERARLERLLQALSS